MVLVQEQVTAYIFSDILLYTLNLDTTTKTENLANCGHPEAIFMSEGEFWVLEQMFAQCNKNFALSKLS